MKGSAWNDDAAPGSFFQSLSLSFLTLLQYFNAMCAMAYSAVSAIGIAVFYYLLRPKDAQVFQIWWRRGRYVRRQNNALFTCQGLAVLASRRHDALISLAVAR